MLLDAAKPNVEKKRKGTALKQQWNTLKPNQTLLQIRTKETIEQSLIITNIEPTIVIIKDTKEENGQLQLLGDTKFMFNIFETARRWVLQRDRFHFYKARTWEQI